MGDRPSPPGVLGPDRLTLHGVDTLSKHLGLSLYEVRYGLDPTLFFCDVDARFSADRLVRLLTRLAWAVDAEVLHLSQQDYEPHGASAAMLVAERPAPEARHGAGRSGLAHLDKSHLAVHTYPEAGPAGGLQGGAQGGVQTLRVDLDLGTCGLRSPLWALDPLLESVAGDVLTLDYRVRGFARDRYGRKQFGSARPESLHDYLPANLLARYQVRERWLAPEQLLLGRLVAVDLDPARQLPAGLSAPQRQHARTLVRQEIDEIFHGC